MKLSRPSLWRRAIAPVCAMVLILVPGTSLAAPPADDVAVTASPDETTSENLGPDEHEINAPRDQARAITVGSHTGLADAIDPAGEMDWFRFSAPTAGTYVVETIEVASTLNTRLLGYHGSTQVASGTGGDGGVSQRMVVNVSIPGTYHVRVAGRYTSQRGTYRIRVLPQYDQGLTWGSNGEPDGHRMLAPAVTVGQSNVVSRAIEPVSSAHTGAGADVDWIRFHAPQPGVYTVEYLDAAMQMVTSGWDAGGNQVASGTGGTGVVEQYVAFNVSIPGTFFVRATSRYSSDSGTYKLRVLRQYDQGHSWTSVHESNNTRMTGYPVGRGEVHDSVLETRRSGTRDRADSDFFNFPVKPGSEHIVDVTATGLSTTVSLYNQAGTQVASRSCSSGNTCTLTTVPTLAGRYHLRVVPRYSDGAGTYTFCARAAGEVCSSVDPSKVTRLQGSDRYATAAAVSQRFPSGASVAFVAAGTDFPDALAGAARAGAVDAPVLLTRSGSLPNATITELQRLKPHRIVVLGGASAINNTVLQQLRTYAQASGSDAVTRISGSNRYETSAKISALFPSGVSTAYIATGRAFPDALSGAALAGANGSPLLLVNTDAIPASVRAELTRLKPQRIVVLGGTGAVSSGVAQSLAQYATASTNKVTRLSGTDRYATSAAVAARFPANVPAAYVATGLDFPDALASAALAGSTNSPVLLTRSTSLPGPIETQLTRLKPAHGYVIGAPGAVGNSIAISLGKYVR